MGRVQILNPVTGELREVKVVTGVDDHSRFRVMASVVERATGRAACVAFAQALARHGVPEEVITDNGKQFTDRFNRYGPTCGEVLFDNICRKIGITHRLTQPASPNQNGKVERFHGTSRPDFLDQAEPFESLQAAQDALDVWVADYNAVPPHQGLDEKVPVAPADRFTAASSGSVTGLTPRRRPGSRRSPVVAAPSLESRSWPRRRWAPDAEAAAAPARAKRQPGTGDGHWDWDWDGDRDRDRDRDCSRARRGGAPVREHEPVVGGDGGNRRRAVTVSRDAL